MAQESFAYSRENVRQHRRYSLPSRAVLNILVAGAEGVAAFALVLSLNWLLDAPSRPVVAYLAVAALVLHGWFSFQAASRAFSRPARLPLSSINLILVWSAIGAMVLLLAKPGAAISAVLWTLISGTALLGMRVFGYRYLMGLFEAGRFQVERIGLIGRAADLNRFEREANVWRRGYQVVASRQLEGGDQSLEAATVFAERCAGLACDHIVVVGEPKSDALLRQTIDSARAVSLNVAFAPLHATDSEFPQLVDILPVGPLHAIRMVNQPLSDGDRLAKRAFDIAVASAAVVMLAPLLIVVALTIRLSSSGPVIYRQERRGFNGRSFYIYKFRSMTVTESGRAMRAAVAGDARITPFGRFIRRVSIDELPQLFNVLKGDMSLVGPRPHAISQDDELSVQYADYARRRRVKPGITGWAQVNGHRGDISGPGKIESRTRFDLYYAENWSLGWDFWILVLTVISAKTRQNAG